MAKKYIDAEKLKAHIEAKMEILWDKLPDADKEHPTDIELRDLGMYMALEGLIDDLDSLQQERPEEPDKDLEEAAEISFDEAYALGQDYMNFLAKGLTENYPRPIGPHWFCEYAKKRFIAGAKWMKEHMMNIKTRR